MSAGLGAWEPVAPGRVAAGAALVPALGGSASVPGLRRRHPGRGRANWNWPFARSLIDLVEPKAAADPFVADWYHATAAYMFAHRMYGEVSPHLGRAAEVVPDDPRILFDRACHLEIQGLPLSQVLLTDADLVVLRARRMGLSARKRDPLLASIWASLRRRPRTKRPRRCSAGRCAPIRLMSRRACGWRACWRCGSGSKKRRRTRQALEGAQTAS